VLLCSKLPLFLALFTTFSLIGGVSCRAVSTELFITVDLEPLEERSLNAAKELVGGQKEDPVADYSALVTWALHLVLLLSRAWATSYCMVSSGRALYEGSPSRLAESAPVLIRCKLTGTRGWRQIPQLSFTTLCTRRSVNLGRGGQEKERQLKKEK